MTLHKAFIWELLGSDGHVLQESPEFPSRAACVADAEKQGVPVVGMSK